MKKETYLTKLAATVVTDANTLGEAKEARKVETALIRFWKKAALANIQENTGRDLLAERANWKTVRYAFNIKATGNVVVELWQSDEFRPAVFGERFVVAKKDLLK